MHKTLSGFKKNALNTKKGGNMNSFRRIHKAPCTHCCVLYISVTAKLQSWFSLP